MKYLCLFLFSGIIVACTSTDKPSNVEHGNRDSINQALLKDSSKYTTIQWVDSVVQNVGTINQGAVIEIKWRFKNSGDKPLIISNVRPGCGCTGAEGPKEPVAPGGEGVITGKFDSEHYPGPQRKQVFVTSNTITRSGTPEEELTFVVQVEPKKS